MSGMNKAERLSEMKWRYIQRAYSDIEMAELLGTRRETIFRDRKELETEYPFVQDEKGRWKIDRSRFISEIKVNLHEALTLYLAARKTARQTRFHQPHTASAVEKLAATLRQPMTGKLLKAAEAVLKQEKDPERIKIIETLTQAWVEQYKVRIRYQGLMSAGITNHMISPYVIEPSIWSDSVYVVAYSDTFEKTMPFKVDRIQTAALSGEPFELPETFDDQQLLKYAWGIWYGDGEPVTVILRFSPAVTKRVKESIWHPLETVTDAEDGGCIWSVEIAEWLEMLPWIRGWGADVEVLEPKDLRTALRHEAQALAELYKVVGMQKQFIAHIREKDKERQSLMEHLNAVSKLTGQFASKIGLKETGELLGLLHDFGKASEKFQRYILSGEGLIDPDAEEYLDPIAHKGKIDHTTAGAQVIYEVLWNKGQKGKIATQVLALCIASHHSGLIDCLKPDGENDFKRRMEKADESTRKAEALSNLREIEDALKGLLSEELIEQIMVKLQSLKEEINESRNNLDFKAGLFVRFLLSCLIDADRLDTADFEMPGNIRIRNYGQYHPWETLIERLDNRLMQFEKKNEVDELRAQVSQACFDFAAKPKGIYQLTVPTGGGKTLASLRFALNHAAQHTKRDNRIDRIFYIIPYTSIIDQNAEEIRKILEDKDENGNLLDRVVLEHHSNLTPEEETRRQNLLAQNWDAPVVLTTQVQFLEALFGAGTRGVRRMHQLANSVIVLDEVQTIPINMIHMLNLALRFLVHTCGATIVLCTATQPPLDKLDNPYRALIINQEQHIIQNERELFEKLKRVEVFDKRKVGGWSDEEIAELVIGQFQEKGSVLAVVNTKKSARSLYHAVTDKKSDATRLYHLSTNMCPAHRLDVLNKMKEELDAKKPVMCVSTQLIEAGVNIDFGAVIRYLAGLDSIAQSAGRCNRHGVREGLGNVWIVNPKEQNIDKLKDIVIGTEKAQRVLEDFVKDPEAFGNERIGLDAMVAYYKYYYYERRNEMEYTVGAKSSTEQNDTLFNLLSTNTLSVEAYKRTHKVAADMAFLQAFQTAAKEFQVIDSPTRGIVVPYKEGDEIIKDLCGAPELEKQYKLLKRAQRYSVNLFQHEFNKLYEMGAIHEVQKGAGVFYLNKEYYSKDFGWSDEPANDMEVLIK